MSNLYLPNAPLSQKAAQLSKSNKKCSLKSTEMTGFSGPPDSFHYTIQGACVSIDKIDNQSEITVTREAMKLFGFHDDQLGGMF